MSYRVLLGRIACTQVQRCNRLLQMQRDPCVCVNQSIIYLSQATWPIQTHTHTQPHGITQCYLPPGRGDIPALTRAEAGTRLSDPGGLQG